jgi:hypothetical protein
MSDTSPTEPSSAADATEPPIESDATASAAKPSAGAHAKDSSPAPRASKLSRWATLAALIIAVLAASVAVAGWFYPNKSASSAPTYSDQQQKDSKKKVCETFGIAEHALLRASHFKIPPDAGPVGGISVLTFQQFAYFGSGAFLRDRLNQEPATPSDLANPASEVATELEELSIGVIAGKKEFTQQELRQSLDEKIKTVADICKKEFAPK